MSDDAWARARGERRWSRAVRRVVCDELVEASLAIGRPRWRRRRLRLGSSRALVYTGPDLLALPATPGSPHNSQGDSRDTSFGATSARAVWRNVCKMQTSHILGLTFTTPDAHMYIALHAHLFLLLVVLGCIAAIGALLGWRQEARLTLRGSALRDELHRDRRPARVDGERRAILRQVPGTR